MQKIILLITLSISYPLFATELVKGEWTGKFFMHGKDKHENVDFSVRPPKENDEDANYKIYMIYQERPYKFEKLSLSNNELKFVLDTGNIYDCVLTSSDSRIEKIKECKSEQGYCGKCIHEAADEKRKIIIDMLPPPIE